VSEKQKNFDSGKTDIWHVTDPNLGIGELELGAFQMGFVLA